MCFKFDPIFASHLSFVKLLVNTSFRFIISRCCFVKVVLLSMVRLINSVPVSPFDDKRESSTLFLILSYFPFPFLSLFRSVTYDWLSTQPKVAWGTPLWNRLRCWHQSPPSPRINDSLQPGISMCSGTPHTISFVQMIMLGIGRNSHGLPCSFINQLTPNMRPENGIPKRPVQVNSKKLASFVEVARVSGSKKMLTVRGGIGKSPPWPSSNHPEIPSVSCSNGWSSR